MNNIYPHAGFWKRALAFFIDSIVLSIPMGIVYAVLLIPQGMALANLSTNGTEPSSDVMVGILGRYFASMVLIWLITIIGRWLYFALLESSKKQATLGKMALGIKVTDSLGRRISFARATGRFFGKMISGMTLYFGFYMAGFTQKRQALHDLLADTYVIDKNYQEQDKQLPALPFSKAGCAAGIIVAIAPIILYMGLVLLIMFASFSASTPEAQQTATHPAAITQSVQS